jgi:uncharacterized membrane-anchored protein
LGFWAVASVIYAFAAGRGRIINILISVYMAQLLTIKAPFLSHALSEKLNVTVASLQQLITFVVIFLVLFLFMGRYVFRTSADSKRLGSLLFGVIFSFLQIGLLINIILSYLPPSVLSNFSPLVQTVFIQNYSGFVWLLLPLVFLMFLGKFCFRR